jgi:hypothetical protein
MQAARDAQAAMEEALASGKEEVEKVGWLRLALFSVLSQCCCCGAWHVLDPADNGFNYLCGMLR